MSELVRAALKILEIVSAIREIASDMKNEADEDDDSINNDEKVNILKVLKSTVSGIFSKKTLKAILKDFFSVKSLIILIIGTLSKFIGKRAVLYLGYEKSIDKCYEILIRSEAKVMITKRKAKKNKDKYTEECCDKMIEYIEEMKKERIKERMKDKDVFESSILEEYKGNEYNVNTFKIVMRDINDAMMIEKQNLNMYCDTATYIVRRSLEITEDNYKDKLKLIDDKITRLNTFVKDDNRRYDRQSLESLFKKYGNMFSVKYSSYGLAAREKFEKKLADFSKDIYDTMTEYQDTLYDLLKDSEDDEKKIDTSLETLINKVYKKTNPSIANTIKRLVNDVNDDSRKCFDICKEFIKWCNNNLKTQTIKSSFQYILLNALFK